MAGVDSRDNTGSSFRNRSSHYLFQGGEALLGGCARLRVHPKSPFRLLFELRISRNVATHARRVGHAAVTRRAGNSRKDVGVAHRLRATVGVETDLQAFGDNTVFHRDVTTGVGKHSNSVVVKGAIYNRDIVRGESRDDTSVSAGDDAVGNRYRAVYRVKSVIERFMDRAVRERHRATGVADSAAVEAGIADPASIEDLDVVEARRPLVDDLAPIAR